MGPWYCDQCKEEVAASRRQHYATILHHFHTPSSLHLPPFVLQPSNRGYQMMLRAGWQEEGLGAQGAGRLNPPKTLLKRDKLGLGAAALGKDRAARPRVTHFQANDLEAVRTDRPGPAAAKRVKPQQAANHARDHERALRHLLS